MEETEILADIHDKEDIEDPDGASAGSNDGHSLNLKRHTVIAWWNCIIGAQKRTTEVLLVMVLTDDY